MVYNEDTNKLTFDASDYIQSEELVKSLKIKSNIPKVPRVLEINKSKNDSEFYDGLLSHLGKTVVLEADGENAIYLNGTYHITLDEDGEKLLLKEVIEK